MDAFTYGHDDKTLPLALEALHSLAGELPLEVILLELRGVYRAAEEEPLTRTNADYQHICDSWIRSLDAALWRLETDEQ